MRRLISLTTLSLCTTLLACGGDDTDTGISGASATFTDGTGDDTGDETSSEPECGNGMVEEGEACDDGNQDDTDACLSTCEEATCGDGFVQAGVETCDDANDIDTDDCPSTCQAATCGDGFVQEGVETCDDANDVDTDECPTTCQSAACGDGFVQEGVEECDDGNMDDTDECPGSCMPAVCGDGYLQAGIDVCDDGNLDNDDGCDSDCVPSAVTEVAAGALHTCALTRTGNVRCWGRAALGRLGFPGVGNIRPQDSQTLTFPAPVTAVRAGSSHTCVLLDNAEAYCWGAGGNGRLGYGTTDNVGDDENAVDAGPIQVGQGIKQIEAGLTHTCAILADDTIKCWGAGGLGQLGTASTADIGDDELPDSVASVTPNHIPAQINAGGGDHTCGWFDEANAPYVKCWGANSSGQLGIGSTDNIGDDELLTSTADTILNITDRPTYLAVGSDHSCAIMESKVVRCWGEGDNGRLGQGNTNDLGDDEQVSLGTPVPLGMAVVDIAMGGGFACAVGDVGEVRCWGAGEFGQLGNKSTDDLGDDDPMVEDLSMSPLVVFPEDFEVVQVEAGNDHTCAVSSAGTVICWGNGNSGRLGYATDDNVGDDEDPADAGLVQVFPIPEKMP